ncbi:hypothetical protein JXL19_11275 [bacterium]|nr:hypothetical protein [bacterium]
MILTLSLFFLLCPNECQAQRRTQNRRKYFNTAVSSNQTFNDTTDRRSVSETKDRRYEIVFGMGLGNFKYEEFLNSGGIGRQSICNGDMLSLKSSISLDEIDGAWEIDIGTEVFGTSERLERWWSGRELFQVNKLFVKGLGMETILGYNFREMALSPFPILAKPDLGFGFVYRFYGMRRKDIKYFYLSEQNKTIPVEKDYVFFGFEPKAGLSFVMEDGKTTLYINIGTGIYGVNVENNYSNNAVTDSPNKTYGRSILSSIGLRGDGEVFFYQIGYSVFRLKIDARDSVSEARVSADRLYCDAGVKF